MKSVLLYVFIALLLAGSGKNDAKKGNTAYENGDYDEAVEYYRSALVSEPNNAKYRFNLANALAKQDEIQEAIESYLDFIELTELPEEKALAEYNIGTLLANNENWEPALKHLKNALKIAPEDNDAKINYELALQQKEEDPDNGDDDDQNNDSSQQPEPTEYALAMKKQAEKLVSERKYNKAYNLMLNALEVDPSVSNFNDFIDRVKSIDNIEN